MQTSNRILDDMAKVASGAVSAVTGVKGDADNFLRRHVEKLLNEMDLVTREEFDAVKAMAANARSEQEKLEARVAELEAKPQAIQFLTSPSPNLLRKGMT